MKTFSFTFQDFDTVRPEITIFPNDLVNNKERKMDVTINQCMQTCFFFFLSFWGIVKSMGQGSPNYQRRQTLHSVYSRWPKQSSFPCREKSVRPWRAEGLSLWAWRGSWKNICLFDSEEKQMHAFPGPTPWHFHSARLGTTNAKDNVNLSSLLKWQRMISLLPICLPPAS